ncbi:MAG TPA: hypothetical protein VGF28_16985 [Thermoanaerobaculia bacterium]
MSITIELGDVFEIETPRGFAYLQYIYNDKTMGVLIRVLPGIYTARPEDINELASEPEVFFTFFPVAHALRKKIVRRVGAAAIPSRVARPPLLRSPGRINPLTRAIENWWLWDGNQSWCVDRLDDEQKQLSVKAIWNDTLLIERIVAGWRPAEGWP